MIKARDKDISYLTPIAFEGSSVELFNLTVGERRVTGNSQ